MNIAEWKFCPFCGANGIQVDGNAFECSVCQRRIYANIAASAVMVFYTSDGRVVMSERAHDPERGKCDFPGGFVDPQETAGDTMIRELREEVSATYERDEITLWCTSPNLYENADGVITHVLDIVFLREITEDEFASFVPADDVASLQLVNPCDVPCEKIAFESVHTIIRKFCKERIWEQGQREF